MSVTQPSSTGALPPAAQPAGVAVASGATRARRPNRWYRPKSVVGKVLLWVALLAFSRAVPLPVRVAAGGQLQAARARCSTTG